MAFDIHIIPVLSDNYVYVLRDEAQNFTALIDAGEAAPVVEFLEARGWTLNLLVNTHHHGDHIAGNAALIERYGCPLAAPEAERGRIDNITFGLSEGDDFDIGGEPVTIIETPGHTSGHICLYMPQSRALFAGDTMFSLGCGRIFEGTPKQMFESFAKLKALPDETRLYCGHEYTAANGAFALSIFPENEVLHLRMQMVRAQRQKNQPTLPVTLGLEKQTNPFCLADNLKQFALYRRLKDNFQA